MKQVESFFWGIIAALGALIMELIVFVGFSTMTSAPTSFWQLFVQPQFILIGVCIEEIFKYIIISKRIEMLSMQRSYLVNSFLVGLGFFSIELGLIFLTGVQPTQLSLLVEIAVIHIGTAGIMGYVVATKNPRKVSTFINAILLTSFFHGAYNLLVLDRTYILNYAVFFLLAIIVVINIVNLIRINSKLAQD